MITMDDVKVSSAYDLPSGGYKMMATLMVACTDELPMAEGNPRAAVAVELHSWELKDKLLDFIYGDIRRKLDRAAGLCQEFRYSPEVVKAAFRSISDVLDGKKEDDHQG